MTGGAQGVVAVARIYGEVPDWFRLRARRVVCTKGVSIRDRSIRARDISTSPRRIYRDSGAWRDCKSPFEDRWYQVLCGTLVGWGVAEWCGVENSARETKRRRGAQERTEGTRGVFDRRRKRAKGKRERELAGRNKLARNERQIASELSARSPDVIEAAMLLPPPPPFLLLLRLCLRVSLCFLPSISLTSSYPEVRPIWFFLTLSRALHLRSPWTGPRGVRKETEAARQVSSHFLFLSFTVISPSYSAPFLQPYISPTILMDACRSTRDSPHRCPSTNFVHVVRIRAASSFFLHRILAWQVCHFVDPENWQFFLFSSFYRFHVVIWFFSKCEHPRNQSTIYIDACNHTSFFLSLISEQELNYHMNFYCFLKLIKKNRHKDTKIKQNETKII